MTTKRTIILTESQKDLLKDKDYVQQEYDNILAESFCPNAQQVVIIKKFLDKNFVRDLIDDIDEFAKPTKVRAIKRMLMGSPIETLRIDDDSAALMLVDKFPKMVSDKNDLKKLMKQVIKDWYNKKITDNGILTVNYL